MYISLNECMCVCTNVSMYVCRYERLYVCMYVCYACGIYIAPFLCREGTSYLQISMYNGHFMTVA